MSVKTPLDPLFMEVPLYKWEELLEKSIYFCFTLISFVIEIFIIFFINVIYLTFVRLFAKQIYHQVWNFVIVLKVVQIYFFFMCVCVCIKVMKSRKIPALTF